MKTHTPTPNSWEHFITSLKELTTETIDYKLAMKLYISGKKSEDYLIKAKQELEIN